MSDHPKEKLITEQSADDLWYENFAAEECTKTTKKEAAWKAARNAVFVLMTVRTATKEDFDKREKMLNYAEELSLMSTDGLLRLNKEISCLVETLRYNLKLNEV